MLLGSITLTAKSSKKNERRQVNEKVYKLERVYRDCIKMTRDKTRIYSILHDMHQALDDSDQTSSFHHEFRRERKPDLAEEESVGLLNSDGRTERRRERRC